MELMVCLTAIVPWLVQCLCLILAQNALRFLPAPAPVFSHAWRKTQPMTPQHNPWHLGMKNLKNGSEDKRDSLIHANMPKRSDFPLAGHVLNVTLSANIPGEAGGPFPPKSLLAPNPRRRANRIAYIQFLQLESRRGCANSFHAAGGRADYVLLFQTCVPTSPGRLTS